MLARRRHRAVRRRQALAAALASVFAEVGGVWARAGSRLGEQDERMAREHRDIRLP